MNEEPRGNSDSLPLSVEQDIDTVCLRFEKAWQAGQRPPIEPYLAEAAAEVRAALLRELVALDVAYRRRAGQRPTPEEYAGRFPEITTLLGEVFAREADPQATSPPEETALASAPRPGGRMRYRSIRLHAAGGLGEVHLATDTELGRQVALKRIRGARAGDHESCWRFVREAEVTGRLEHPGVVPVYGLVQDESGQPCYAMRFVEGETLTDAVRRYHATKDQDAGQQRLALRELLGRFVAVCNTVAYAHSKGVVHRDLKPANVMLGKYGETLVIDWGLAKPPGKGEAGEEGQAGDELRTRQGAVAGTPAYMSPEQAVGDWEKVGPHSDIYSLGATLYEILVNRPPVVGSNPAEVASRAQRAEWAPPRLVKPGVPKALEAVCLKALACEPGGRYSTATELAKDVERWLADEPVRAYREPWVARARRWTRRHGLLVTGGAAAAAALAISVSIGAALLGAANTRLGTANERLQRQTVELTEEKARTQEALQAEAKRRKEAREALDSQTSLVMEGVLGRQAEVTEDHRRFLDQALRAYEQFAADTGQEEESRAGVARAYFRVGRIRQRLGEGAGSAKAYGESVERFERLAADFPDNHAYSRDLATCLRYLGDLRATQSDQPAARAAYGKARAAHQQTLVVLERKARESSGNVELRQDLANTCNDLGIVLYELREWAAARSAYERGVAINRELAGKLPQVRTYRQDQAKGLYNIGLLHANQSNWKAARAAYEQALELRKRLAEESPKVTAYRQDLVSSYNNLGLVMQHLKEPKAARALYESALPLRKRLAEEFPAIPAYRFQLAGGHNNLGNVLLELGEWRSAQAAFESALAITTQLMKDHPVTPGYRREVALHTTSLGNALRHLGAIEKSRDSYLAAVTLREQLTHDVPTDLSYKVELASSFNNLGSLAMATGRPGEGLEWYGKAVAAVGPVLAKSPRHVNGRAGLRNAHDGRAWALDRLGRHAEAAGEWARAVEVNPDPGKAAEYRCKQALALARAGERARAVAAANELAGAKDASHDTLYACARVCAVASAGETGEGSPREQYAARAVELLRKAMAAGFTDVGRLMKEKDFDSIHRREDFRQLLAQTDEKAKP